MSAQLSERETPSKYCLLEESYVEQKEYSSRPFCVPLREHHLSAWKTTKNLSLHLAEVFLEEILTANLYD